MNPNRVLTLAALAAASIIGVGCHKKVAATPPTTPAATPAAQATAPARTTEARIPAARPQQASAEAPRSRYPDAATVKRIEELLARIQDAYFDYDKHLLRKDAQ